MHRTHIPAGSRPADLPRFTGTNYVKPARAQWTTDQIAELLNTGALVPWDEPQPPHFVSGMGVDETRGHLKPRLIIDMRFANWFMRELPFGLDAVGNAPSLVDPGGYMSSVDHKSGYHHVLLAKHERTYFGVRWKGRYYVFTCLCFGWSPAPYIYHTLTEATCMYMRMNFRLNTLCYIDDIWLAIAAAQGYKGTQRQQCGSALFVVCAFLTKCGYYLAWAKIVLDPAQVIRFLGILVDSLRRMFFVPEDRVLKVHEPVTTALQRGTIEWRMLESVVGKCVSMAVAVPAARLYTRAMYALLRTTRFTVRHDAHVQLTPAVETEFRLWRRLLLPEGGPLINGCAWLEPQHDHLQIRLTLHTDASSRRWGGRVWWQEETLNAAGEFSLTDAARHINWKEMRAVVLVMRAVARWRPESLYNCRIHLWIDNQVAKQNFLNGGGTSLELTAQAIEMFWLGMQYGWSLTWSYIPSADNLSDALTREDAGNDVHLHEEVFTWLAAQQAHGVNVDWCATTANAQRKSRGGELLPFVSRYLQEGASAVDVLAQHLAWVPGAESDTPAHGYCYPPPAILLPLVEIAQRCGARMILVTTGSGDLWWPQVWAAARWRVKVAEARESSTRLRGMRPDGSPTTFAPKGAVWAWGCDFNNLKGGKHSPILLHLPVTLGATPDWATMQQEGKTHNNTHGYNTTLQDEGGPH